MHSLAMNHLHYFYIKNQTNFMLIIFSLQFSHSQDSRRLQLIKFHSRRFSESPSLVRWTGRELAKTIWTWWQKPWTGSNRRSTRGGSCVNHAFRTLIGKNIHIYYIIIIIIIINKIVRLICHCFSYFILRQHTQLPSSFLKMVYSLLKIMSSCQ